MKNPLLTWIEKRFNLTRMEPWKPLISYGSATGIHVSENTALRSTAVWACVKLLSETLASLPLIVYRRLTPRGKERAAGHPLYKLLHDAPNPEMTSYTFREVMQGHLVTWGNCFAEIDYGNGIGDGYPQALWPLLPNKMQVGRDKESGKLIYSYLLPDGTTAKLAAWQVWHVPGFGFDGIVGYSPIQMAREAIGLSLATEEFGARFFGNGASPGGVLEHPNKLSVEAQERLRKSWNEMHSGLSNQHRIAILEEGMKFSKVGIPPNDAQFLETRKFQINEIARFFNVPPHMIGDLDRATFSNIEQQSLEFVVYTIRPWLVRWEQAASLKLLGAAERSEYFVEFLVDGLLRGDSASRAAYYREMFYMGAMSPNDIREKENLNPLDQGDEYYIPLNMVPVGAPRNAQPAAADEQVQLTSVVEVRQIPERISRNQGALLRHKTAQAHRKLFEAAGAEIVKREKTHVLKAAREHLTQRSIITWNEWLDSFYREYGNFVVRKIKPIVQEMIEAITPLAANEVNQAPELADKGFADKYVEIFARQYTGSSKGQLKQVVRKAFDDNADPIGAVSQRLGEWSDRRPGKIAMHETVACSNAVAKAVFIGCGINRLAWCSIGDKLCTVCEEMDGQVVAIESKFSESSGKLQSVGHPPIHYGCQCQIVPR